MRRVLMLTASWPPVGRASTRRPVRLARRLPAHGWEPVVLTPAAETHPFLEGAPPEASLRTPPVEVLRAPGLLPLWRLRRGARDGLARAGLSSLGAAVWRGTRGLPFPDHFAEWAPAAVRAARRAGPVDAVWATGGPFGVFVAGAAVAAALDRPLVLDYRDPWTQNTDYPEARVHLPRACYLALERALLGRAAGVSYVHADMRRGHAVEAVIPNGFDPADAADVAPTDHGRPTLLYAGGSYPGRDLAGVLRAMAARPDDGLQLVVYGALDRESADLLARTPLDGRVQVRAPVPNAEIVAHMRGASALLLLIAPQHPYGIPAKLFDYLGAGRPVLGYGPSGSDSARLVAEWGIGRWVEAGDTAGLEAALSAVAAGLPYAPVAEAIAPWSADHMAAATAALLDRAVGA